jgi:predicted transcriptional regulator of viral defense system
MAGDRRVSGSYPHELAKVRVARVAKRQHNRIASHQLTRLGVSGSTVRDWMRAGYLHRRLRGVYAVGSAARTTESDLFEAVLYAGPGAMLSHATAASWLGLIDHASPLIHVSTPRRRTSARGILIHNRRLELERVTHDGIPTTTVAQALLDLAAMGELTLVRRALARLDYQHRFRREGTAGSVRRRASRRPCAGMGDRELRPPVRAYAQPTRGRLADLL